MQRLWVTVAFSALVLGVASVGLQAQTTGTSAKPSMSSGSADKTASQTTQGTTPQGMMSQPTAQGGMQHGATPGTATSAAAHGAKTDMKDQSATSSGMDKSAIPASKAKSMAQDGGKPSTMRSATRKASNDNVADDLNRQSLSQMTGGATYGSSGAPMAPASNAPATPRR